MNLQPTKDTSPLVFGFDFYGAGNIGDDLMLAGYLGAAASFPFSTHSSCIKVESQRLRFPSVTWAGRQTPGWKATKERLLESGAPWVGVGDTPFQMSSGTWSVNHLAKEARALARLPSTPMVMVGVGAEQSVLKAKDTLRPVMDRLDRLWLRDSHTAELLEDLGVSNEKLRVGADLAHIILPLILDSQPPAPPTAKIAINYFSERHDADSIAALYELVGSQASNDDIVFASTEARPQMERSIYNRLQWRAAINGQWLDRRKQGSKFRFIGPNYNKDSIRNLISPIETAECFLSSRYHGVLTAAWAGRRIGILGGRSSKVDSLAKELNVPILLPPYTKHGLLQLVELASRVDRVILEQRRAAAINSMTELGNYLTGST
jgi:polysaccharide pyruvyl transferase WcaK-like protein